MLPIESTSLPEILAIAAASFAVGYALGRFVRFRDVNGHLRPEIVANPLREWAQGRWFRLSLVVLFLAATGLMVQFSVTQRRCNSEFQRTIIERADIANDDNRARRIADDARRENDVAVGELVEELLGGPPGEGRRVLEGFRVRYSQNIARQDATLARQETNDQRRGANPYPRC